MAGEAASRVKIPRSPLDAIPDLERVVRATADEAEQLRRAPDPLVEAIRSAGLFRLCVPRSIGGTEIDVPTLLRVIETVSAWDGSAGWIVMIGATSGFVAGYLGPDARDEVYGEGPDTALGGVFAPKGRARPIDGGYRVGGRWPFASGCQHARWLLAGCVTYGPEGPVLLESGLPESRMVLLPAREVTILDTWHTAGLCGTGSHDIEVRDARVPGDRSVSLVSDPPREAGPLYRFPPFALLALGVSAVALGIARAAIHELVALARGKRPAFSRSRLAERSATQADVARAHAAVGSARALLAETVGVAWRIAESGRDLSLDQRARLRMAATNASLRCAEAVDLMYGAGGGTSVYRTSPLQRCFRDVHALTQHSAVAPATLELVGRVMLSLPTDASLL